MSHVNFVHGMLSIINKCSYLIENGMCFLTLTEKSYPKRLAFLFLEEIAKEFEADLRAEYGEE